MSALARLRTLLRVQRTHRRIGIGLMMPGCPVPTGKTEPCCCCPDLGCEHARPKVCGELISKARYVLIGRCRHHRKTA